MHATPTGNILEALELGTSCYKLVSNGVRYRGVPLYTSMWCGVCGAQLTLQFQICLDRWGQQTVQTPLP